MPRGRGNLLEDFSESLFNSINGFIVRYKRSMAMVSRTQPEHDYDLIIHNTSKVLPELGNYVLVECKDWQKRVGYPEIAKFLHKLHSRKCVSGFIIALGDVVYGDFNPTLKRTFDQDGIAVIVIDKRDLDNIMSNSVNLITMIRKKYEEVRFGLI